MAYAHTVAGCTYRFDDLKTLLARATPERSGDQLAGVAATPMPFGAAEFGAYMAAETEKWGKVVKGSSVKPE